MLNLKVVQFDVAGWEIRLEGVTLGSGATIEQATAEAAITLLRLLGQIRAQAPSPSEPK
jgi:hypothetical protein